MQHRGNGRNGFHDISGSLYSVDVIIIGIKPDLNDEIAQDLLVSYISLLQIQIQFLQIVVDHDASTIGHTCNGEGIIRIISDNNSSDIYNLSDNATIIFENVNIGTLTKTRHVFVIV